MIPSYEYKRVGITLRTDDEIKDMLNHEGVSDWEAFHMERTVTASNAYWVKVWFKRQIDNLEVGITSIRKAK